LNVDPKGYENLRLWDVASGKEVMTWKGHPSKVEYVAFLPEGKEAVSSGNDGKIRLWNVVTGDELPPLVANEGDLSQVMLTCMGKSILFVGKSDRSIAGTNKLYDIASKKVVLPTEKVREHGGFVAASMNGIVALSVGATPKKEPDIVLWNLNQGVLLNTIKNHDLIRNAIFSPDGKFLVLAVNADKGDEEDRYLALWNASSGVIDKKLRGYERGVNGLAVTPENKRVIAVCGDGQMRCWDLTTEKVIWTATAKSELCAVSSDGKWVATSKGMVTRMTKDLRVEIRDVATGQQLKMMQPKEPDREYRANND
jgi:WD40 repeat protein